MIRLTNRTLKRHVCAWSTALVLAVSSAALADVATTRHNLSVSGPGDVKSLTETRICVFCHTPHNAAPTAQLWNRADAAAAHTPYTSTTMDALPGQPTGASRLCLSCHDGTIALGAVLSEPDPIAMSGGVSVMPDGASNLGVGLHDDHPISFPYTPTLAAQDGELLDPATLTGEVRLDADGELQCTACHDPHDDPYGDFLVLPATDAALCEACHIPDQWDTATHNTGAALIQTRLSGEKQFQPNACRNCHDPHTADGADRILTSEQEEVVCLFCHNSTVPTTDIDSELAKASNHPVSLTTGVHDPREAIPVVTSHVECVDCHNPHAATSGAGVAPNVPGALTGVRGLDGDGDPIDDAPYEYQVCYKCHADAPGLPEPVTPRQIVQGNTRLEFDPDNPSFHPVEVAGVNPDVPSLLSPYTTSSIIGCTDCHTNNEGPAAGGSGPAGPHGSIYPNLLGWNYETGIGQLESPTTYALCYRCHDRDSILFNVTFRWHRRHVSNEQISCNACHDPHGVNALQGDASANSHLINFDMTYASPEESSGLLEFIDLGDRHGSCTLMCHGENHVDDTY